MQTIKVYIRANSTRGTIVDSYNNALSGGNPTFTLCLNSALAVELFKGPDGNTKYSQAELGAYTWKFYAHNSYNAENPLISTESGITVSSGVVTIPVDTTASAVAAWLGSAETGNLYAEMQGYVSGAQYAEMVIQFSIAIRNRVKR